MKILLIAGQFYPDLAGSGTATHYIANDLARRGHDVTVYVDSKNTYYEFNPHPNFTLEFIPDFKAFMTGGAGFKAPTEAIHSLLDKHSFDVIHVFSYMPMLLLSLMKSRITTPTFFTFWNAPDPGRRALGLYESPELDLQLARQIINMKTYSEMILGSRCSYESALDLGADPVTTSYAYHGIDMKKFLQDMHTNHVNIASYFDESFTDADTVITLPGRITARKGVFEAVRALATVRKQHDVKLLLTGTGSPIDTSAVAAVTSLAEQLHVRDSLHISTRMISQEHMPSLYARSALVIVPSYFEGLGFTAIEALTAARPLITTDVAGLNEVGVNDVNCRMIPAKNTDALAEAVSELLINKAKAARLAQNGPSSVKKFDMGLFVDYIEKTYRATTTEVT